MTTHSILGASSAKRWGNCPGSIREIQKLPELLRNWESEFAKEGTAMHKVGELCLLNRQQAEEYVGRVVEGVEFTEAMAFATQEYADAVRFSREMNGGKLLVEQRIAAPELHPQAFGTLDAAVLAAPLAHLFDLKGGEGLQVDVIENDQFRQYAWILLHDKPEFTEITLTVVQPRREHAEGSVRSETLTRAELQQWAETIMLPRMRDTEREDAPLKAGDWCQFCPVGKANKCPVQKAALTSMAVEASVEILSDDDLAAECRLIAPAKKKIAALEAERFRRMMAGRKIAGSILVPKKSDRVWRLRTIEDTKQGPVELDVEQMARIEFGPDAYTEPAFKSPAQLEKLDKAKYPQAKAFVVKYAYKPDTGYTVKDDDGKTEGVTVQTDAQAFAGVLTNGS